MGSEGRWVVEDVRIGVGGLEVGKSGCSRGRTAKKAGSSGGEEVGQVGQGQCSKCGWSGDKGGRWQKDRVEDSKSDAGRW